MTDTNSNATSARFFNQMVAAVLKAEAALKAAPWGDTEEKRSAHNVARESLEAARESLITAIRLAPWGRNGAAFITDCGNGPGASSERERTLYINGLRRAVVYYNYHSPSQNSGWIQVFTAEKAKEERQVRREGKRKWDATYEAEIELVAKALAEANITHVDEDTCELSIDGWTYTSGQMGGYFWKEGHLNVSAKGAFRRAEKIQKAAMRQPCRFDSPFAGLKIG